MGLQTAALDHACNVVRRQVQDELKDLTLFFIAHEPGGRLKALNAQKEELLEHPAGEDLYPALKLCAQFKPDNSMFVGFSTIEQKKRFSFVTQKKTLAAFYVSTADFENEDEIRQYIYHMTWQALSLMDHYENGEKEFFIEQDGSVRPAYNLINLARENMLADAFSAIMLELQGHKHFIHDLAKRRCEMALQPIAGYRAEQFPYPIAADATQIVYDEFVDGVNTRTKLINQAIEITREIGFTYDDNSIRQWTVFSTASQEMAWLGFDKTKVLGTAIYTSEDPYVRSTAYIVAETLNMEPAPLTDLGRYNPFTDQEVNERLHNKLRDEAFQNVLSKLALEEDVVLFTQSAMRQNAKLVEGHVVGWGADAFMAAQTAFIDAFKNNERPTEKATLAYQDARKNISWETMIKLSRLIMNKRRQGHVITANMIIDLCQGHETLSPIAQAVKWAMPPEPEEETKGDEEKASDAPANKELEPAEIKSDLSLEGDDDMFQ